ncbi:MAG: TetR/AcrR family transcriptional regulator [Photobacterium frigidiphilum]|uniref:TetR/AcrR family transcriptional regulator n=1 Tax=Photobacterium frigidiphilum TaxID=264736 RepID=UPI0030020AA5
MNDKKKLLIDTALHLFYENGINSVGINEILKVSGVAKKTMYNHFKSKDELVVATLELRDKLFLEWLDTKLQCSVNKLDVINILFSAMTAWFKNEVPELSPFRGCFFINTSAECSNKNNAIYLYCANHKVKVRNLIQKYLQTEDESLLDMICLLKEGAIVSAYLNQDLNAANKCIPLITRYVDTA